MQHVKQNIRDLSQDELIIVLEKQGEKKFRAKQVYEWLWKKGIRSFDEMKNIPKSLVEFLELHYFLDCLAISDLQKSNDGTIKCAFTTHDNRITECCEGLRESVYGFKWEWAENNIQPDTLF